MPDRSSIPRPFRGRLAEIGPQGAVLERLVVECHPKLIREDRILPFQRLLGSGTRLELALGLETAHPEVLERLNKGIDRESFQRSAHWIRFTTWI